MVATQKKRKSPVFATKEAATQTVLPRNIQLSRPPAARNARVSVAWNGKERTAL